MPQCIPTSNLAKVPRYSALAPFLFLRSIGADVHGCYDVNASPGPEPHFSLISKATAQTIHSNDRGLQGTKRLAGDRSGGLLEHGIAGEGIHIVGGPHQIAVYRVTVPEEPAQYSRAALRNVCPSSTDWIAYAGTAAANRRIGRRSSAEEDERAAAAAFDPMCEICKQPFNGPGMRCRGGTHFVCMPCAIKPPPPKISPHSQKKKVHSPKSGSGGGGRNSPLEAGPALEVPKRADVQVTIGVLDFENIPTKNVQMRAFLGKQPGVPIPGSSGVLWNLERKVMSRYRSQRAHVKLDIYDLSRNAEVGPVLIGTAKIELREANRPPAWIFISVPRPTKVKGQKRTKSHRGPRSKIRAKLVILEH